MPLAQKTRQRILDGIFRGVKYMKGKVGWQSRLLARDMCRKSHQAANDKTHEAYLLVIRWRRTRVSRQI